MARLTTCPNRVWACALSQSLDSLEEPHQPKIKTTHCLSHNSVSNLHAIHVGGPVKHYDGSCSTS